MSNALHLLEDYVDTLDGLPAELVNQFNLLAQKDAEYEEIRRSLFKKRNLLLKAEDKEVDLQMQATLRRKADKDHQRAVQLIEEKIEIERRLQLLVESHLERLDRQISHKLATTFKAPNDISADIPDPQIEAVTATKTSRSGNTARSSPKKRTALNDEPIDPNEPVYCVCRQVSFGDMIACDGASCTKEWFHLSCVGLHAPPKGKWYCEECRGEGSSVVTIEQAADH